MEGIIIFIIMMILGAVFNRQNKPGDPSQPNRPTNQQGPNRPNSRPQPKGPRQRLEDYAKDLQRELQPDRQPERAPREKTARKERTVIQTQEAPTIDSPIRQGRNEPRTGQGDRRRGRLSAHNEPVPAQQAKLSKADLFPLEGDDAMKAIILSEIFSPPKSKR